MQHHFNGQNSAKLNGSQHEYTTPLDFRVIQYLQTFSLMKISKIEIAFITLTKQKRCVNFILNYKKKNF